MYLFILTCISGRVCKNQNTGCLDSVAVEHKWEGFPARPFFYFPNFGVCEPIQKLNLRKSNEEKRRTHCPHVSLCGTLRCLYSFYLYSSPGPLAPGAELDSSVLHNVPIEHAQQPSR